MNKFKLGTLVLFLLVILSFIYLGVLSTIAIGLLFAILFRIVPILWRGVVIVWQFIEFIIFAPYRYTLGGHTGNYPRNPLVKLFQFDLSKLFKGF